MTAVAQKTVLTGCLAPIDKNGLETAHRQRQGQSEGHQDLKCKTVAEASSAMPTNPQPRALHRRRAAGPARRRHPRPIRRRPRSPRSARAWRSACHANAVHRGWIVNQLELELEGDLNITAVWGHRRRQREAGRLHGCARQGRHGMRGRFRRARSMRW